MSTEARHRLEAAVPSLCSSVDGRRFGFQASLHGLELQPGGYVAIGGGRLGQVHTLEHAWVDAPALDGADGVGGVAGRRRARQRRRPRGRRPPFHDEPLASATAEAVRHWIERTRPQRASLDVGALALEPSVRFGLDAGGFDRHTFFCGQSGSGKTYALGTVLERLCSRRRSASSSSTRTRTSSGSPRCGTRSTVARHDRLPRCRAGLAVRRAGEGAERLHVRFVDCDAAEQAAVLRLDPIRDRDEYGALVELLEAGPPPKPGGARRRHGGGCSRRPIRGTRRSARDSATSASTAGGSGRSATRTRCRTSSPRAGRAAWSSTSARWTRPASRRSPRRACSPLCGAGAPSASPS